MRKLCQGKESFTTTAKVSAKVYYNAALAKENLEAAVIYATILNLLNIEIIDGGYEKWESGVNVGGDAKDLGRVNDTILLENQKLFEGSGLSLNKVRRAVRWLIDHKLIDSKTGFGNKKTVRLPNDQTADLEELPTESHEYHPSEDEPTEAYPHKD